jgi:transposase
VRGLPYPSDLTDEQWELLEPVFNSPGKRGRKHADDLRSVVDAMLYIAQTGCQWRFLPESFGPWTRVWSQFRRWSRNGTWARALTLLHAAVRKADGRAEETPSMLVIDTHLARGASNGETTFHDRGGPYGRTKGAKRVVAVDVTGLPVGALVVPASTHENRASELMLGHSGARVSLSGSSWSWWTAGSPQQPPARSVGNTTSSCAGWGGTTSSRCSDPSGTPGESRLRTAALAGPAGWRSRSRTPLRRLPAGYRSPASQPPSATCHARKEADGDLSPRHEPAVRCFPQTAVDPTPWVRWWLQPR